MTARSTPCEGGCGAYTAWRFCVACQDALASGRAVPGREDRFADVRAQARTVTTPETRRMAPPPVMPQVGRPGVATFRYSLDTERVPVEAPGGRLVGYVTRAELPTLDGVAVEETPVLGTAGERIGTSFHTVARHSPTGVVMGTVEPDITMRLNSHAAVERAMDRHAAITKLIGFVTAEGTTDSAVAALLSEAERLRGAA